MKIKWLLTMVAILALAGSTAMATPAEPWNPLDPNDELNLYEIYNVLYGTAFTSNTDLDPFFISGNWFVINDGSPIQLAAEARYAGAVQHFGWYEPSISGGGPTTLHPLFAVSTTGLLGGSPAAVISPVGDFGFYDNAVGALNNTWYSEAAGNGGDEHILLYATPNPGTYLLAIEDKPFNVADQDHNDLVVELQWIIPEPSSFLLLGMGLAGVLARKKLRSVF
ncbi:MAG: PEP-CTERM sorting domain-containing protein [Candidatus Hydrogenedentes bacterium]|nr:PEP-CTERM sorting domain-containing protein [Candidatus Hydrogenedentota bacterium]